MNRKPKTKDYLGDVVPIESNFLSGTNDMSEEPVPVFIEDGEGLDMPKNISTRAARSLLGQKPGETVKDALARFKL